MKGSIHKVTYQDLSIWYFLPEGAEFWPYGEGRGYYPSDPPEDQYCFDLKELGFQWDNGPLKIKF